MTNSIRPVNIIRQFTEHAAGSVLFCAGKTKVLCTASVQEQVPRFLRDSNQGWLTAEYSLLPSATHTRNQREASRGKQSGRTIEIQRLIGRSLRQAIDLTRIPGWTINIDCDVIQADGGTRCAAITGGYIALQDAIDYLLANDKLSVNPLQHAIAAVSVGLCHGEPTLDLNYAQDSQAETDMNVIMNDAGAFVEVQGTAERGAFSRAQHDALLDLATIGIEQLLQHQRDCREN